MSSISTLMEVAVVDLPYVSTKEKIRRNIRLGNKLLDELRRVDLTAEDIMKWELQLIDIVYRAFEQGKGCIARVNLDRVHIDENKNVVFTSSNSDYVNEDYENELRLLKTMIGIHDDIFCMVSACRGGVYRNKKIATLKVLCDHFYSVAASDISQDSFYNFMDKTRHLFNMIHQGLLNDIMGANS